MSLLTLLDMGVRERDEFAMMNRLRNISIGIFIVYERVVLFIIFCAGRDKVFSLYTNTQVRINDFEKHDIEDSIMDDEELNEIPVPFITKSQNMRKIL